MMPRNLLRAAVLVAALVSVTSSSAANFSPIKFELMPEQRATVLNITNTDNSTKTYDIQLVKWDGVNQTTAQSITSKLDADAPILLSRPRIVLPPHGKATIRIAVAKRSKESSDFYRILVDDITPPEADSSAAAGGNSNASFRMSVSLPLQVRNTKDIVGKLTATTGVEGQLTNSGSNIVSVLYKKQPDGTKDSSVSRYIFPGEVWTTSLKPDELTWLAGLQ